MVLEANTDVLTALQKYYEGLLPKRPFSDEKDRLECAEAVMKFAAQVNEMIDNSRMQVSRAKLLVRITADRKTLVSPPSFPIHNALSRKYLLRH